VASGQSKRQQESAKERSKRKAKIFNAFRWEHCRMESDLERELQYHRIVAPRI
jgi:hypothetical protein